MAGIDKKSFEKPDDTVEFNRGRAHVVVVSDQELWRSELEPGWSWDDEVQPYTEGEKSCSLTHREYVVAGQIRYLMDDGSEVIGKPGDFLVIGPGHRAWVIGEETCVLIDW